jgi:hypothetical protein
LATGRRRRGGEEEGKTRGSQRGAWFGEETATKTGLFASGDKKRGVDLGYFLSRGVANKIIESYVGMPFLRR